ncbi:MAG: hypothetical protein ACRDL0_17205, partial [Thermoleophilaceae bacterium]
MTTKRVLLSAGALLVLLAGGLLIAQMVARGDNDGPGANGTRPTSPPPVSESPSPVSAKEQVREAYLRYWDVFAAEFRKLSTDDLNDVTTGKALRVLD